MAHKRQLSFSEAENGKPTKKINVNDKIGNSGTDAKQASMQGHGSLEVENAAEGIAAGEQTNDVEITNKDDVGPTGEGDEEFLQWLKERFGIDAALCREDGQDDGKDNNSDDGDNERDETDDEHTPTGNRLSKGSSKAIPAVVVGEKYHYSSLAAGHDEVPASAKNLEKVWDDEALACVKAIGNKAAQSGIKVEDDDNVNGEDEVLPSISSTPAKASDDDDDDPSFINLLDVDLKAERPILKQGVGAATFIVGDSVIYNDTANGYKFPRVHRDLSCVARLGQASTGEIGAMLWTKRYSDSNKGEYVLVRAGWVKKGRCLNKIIKQLLQNRFVRVELRWFRRYFWRKWETVGFEGEISWKSFEEEEHAMEDFEIYSDEDVEDDE